MNVKEYLMLLIEKKKEKIIELQKECDILIVSYHSIPEISEAQKEDQT